MNLYLIIISNIFILTIMNAQNYNDAESTPIYKTRIVYNRFIEENIPLLYFENESSFKEFVIKDKDIKKEGLLYMGTDGSYYLRTNKYIYYFLDFLDFSRKNEMFSFDFNDDILLISRKDIEIERILLFYNYSIVNELSGEYFFTCYIDSIQSYIVISSSIIGSLEEILKMEYKIDGFKKYEYAILFDTFEEAKVFVNESFE